MSANTIYTILLYCLVAVVGLSFCYSFTTRFGYTARRVLCAWSLILLGYGAVFWQYVRDELILPVTAFPQAIVVLAIISLGGIVSQILTGKKRVHAKIFLPTWLTLLGVTSIHVVHTMGLVNGKDIRGDGTALLYVVGMCYSFGVMLLQAMLYSYE